MIGSHPYAIPVELFSSFRYIVVVPVQKKYFYYGFFFVPEMLHFRRSWINHCFGHLWNLWYSFICRCCLDGRCPVDLLVVDCCCCLDWVGNDCWALILGYGWSSYSSRLSCCLRHFGEVVRWLGCWFQGVQKNYWPCRQIFSLGLFKLLLWCDWAASWHQAQSTDIFSWEVLRLKGHRRQFKFPVRNLLRFLRRKFHRNRSLRHCPIHQIHPPALIVFLYILTDAPCFPLECFLTNRWYDLRDHIIWLSTWTLFEKRGDKELREHIPWLLSHRPPSNLSKWSGFIPWFPLIWLAPPFWGEGWWEVR